MTRGWDRVPTDWKGEASVGTGKNQNWDGSKKETNDEGVESAHGIKETGAEETPWW